MPRRRKRVHYRACNLCEAICGLEIRLDEGGQIASIRGDREDSFSRGHICPKAVALQDIHADSDRLRRPLRRRPSGWQEVGWKEALDEVARGLRTVQRAHGRDAVAVYQGNPTVHNYGSLLYGPQLVRALGTRSRFSATSVDQMPHQLVAYLMFGHQFLVPVPDIDRTRFVLAFGANPVASNGSMMTAPGVERRLRELRERGGRLVVIDPRRTETARVADRHLFIRPGEDALLLAALLFTLADEDLTAPGRLTEMAKGLDEVGALVARFTPEMVGTRIGIEPAVIRGLARELAAAPAAACYGRFGVSTQSFGTLCQWLINLLNIVTGNLDRPGGAMFSLPAFDFVGRGRGRGGHDRWRSRVRGLPEAGGELPVAVLAEEILTAGAGQIRALVTSCGNPVLSTPNGRRLDAALEDLDFMVSIDFYLNETTRHADLILPPTSPLEHDHYDVAFHALAVRNTARYSPPLFEPPPGALHDWQIFNGLIDRLQPGGGPRRWLERRFRRRGPRAALAVALRAGPHDVTLRKLERAPHGIDLGPLVEMLPGRLWTEDRKIDLVPTLLRDDLKRLEDHLERHPERSDTELALIGRRHVRSNNSWMHNSHRLVKGPGRCTLMVHPRDATRLGLTDGEPVRVASSVSEVTLPAEVTADVMPGVVSLPHGWGHDREGVRLTTAQQHAGVSMNDLTDDQAVDPASGNAVLSGLTVTLAPVAPRPAAESRQGTEAAV